MSNTPPDWFAKRNKEDTEKKWAARVRESKRRAAQFPLRLGANKATLGSRFPSPLFIAAKEEA
jgi:hypothetical protein